MIVDVGRVFLSHNILSMNLSNLQTNNLIKAARSPKVFVEVYKDIPERLIRILLVEESKSHEYSDIPY